jgi:hypothetical protein
MPLTLLASPEFNVSLDPVGVEERIASVAFDVVADLSMPFQQTHLVIKECWFGHEALNAFEAQLNALQHQDEGEATLLNMSERPIIRVIRTGATLASIVRSTDTMGLGASTIEVSGYATEIPEILARYRSFEKWW